MAVGVGVREDAALEHLVGAGLDAGDEVGGREGQLLHLGEVVGGVPVQDDATHGDQGELLVGPDLKAKGQSVRMRAAQCSQGFKVECSHYVFSYRP